LQFLKFYQIQENVETGRFTKV